MKKLIQSSIFVFQLLLAFVFLQNGRAYAQCINADFELGTFGTWSATWGKAPFILPPAASGWAFLNSGFKQGANNAAPNSSPENNQFIMTAGFDSNIGGNLLPVVYPGGGSSSMRLGNSQASGGGESVSYSYMVGANNTSFTYHYAVVLNDAGSSHSAAEQPYFKIRMTANGINIPCASYDVNGSTAASIGSFNSLGTDVKWKPWSSVTIPLNDYVGQTIKVTFETRDCAPGGSTGTHYAYAYIDAGCSPLSIIPSAQAVCPGSNVTLTAPVGAATYWWVGPAAGSIVSGQSTNVATVNKPGTYTVTMTTIGSTPCTYALTATMPGSLPGAVVTVNSTSICAGSSATLTASGALSYSWSPGGTIGNSITVTPGATISYSVTGDAGSGCPSTAVGTINVTPLPVVTVNSATVCGGSSATLTAQGGTTYSWSNGSNANPLINSPGATTSFIVTGTTNGCSGSTTANITVNPKPLVTVNSATICFGASTTLNASGASSYIWSDNSVGSSLLVNTGSSTSLSVTGTTTGCSASAIANITVNPKPVVTINSTTICAGSSATLNAQGANSYSWSPGGTSGTSLSVSPVNTTTYTVIGTSLGCIDDATGTITVNQMPLVSVNSTTICAGASTTLSAQGASSFLWSTGAATNSITVSPGSTSSYAVTGTTNGCSGSSTGIVTVNPAQNPAFSYTPSTICKTGGSNPTPVITGTAGGIFTSSPSLTINAATGVINLAASPLGSYTITYTTAGPCPQSSTFGITIVNIPIADFTYGTYCQNVLNPSPTYINDGSAGVFSSTLGLVFANPANTAGEVDLSASTPGNYTVTNTIASGAGCAAAVSTNTITINAVPNVTVNNPIVCVGSLATLTAQGASNYSWSNGSAANSISANVGVTTSYTVTGTSAGCSSSAIGTINVNPLPVVVVNNTTICAGSSTTINASGANSYSWSDGSISNSIVVSPLLTTSYTVTGTSSGCSVSTIATVTVNQIPAVGVNSTAICQGLTATLTATGANSYLWSNGTIGNTISVTPGINTVYTVTGTTNGCSANVDASVTVTQLPQLTANASPMCVGGSSTVTANGGASYSWSPGGLTGSSITVSPGSTTTYTVTDNTVGCSGTAYATVVVNPLPFISVNPITICEGSSGTLNATGTAVSFLWSDGSVSNPTTISPSATTNYTVIGITGAGCSGVITTTVTVNPVPKVTVTSKTICEGQSVVLTASGGNSYHWSNGNTNASITVKPDITTTLSVTGTNTLTCSSSVLSTIKVFPKPGAQFTGTPNPAGMFDPVVTFNNQSSADVTYWFWSFGDGDVDDDNTPTPIHRYPGDTGSFMATLIVHNAGFCYDTINHLILVGPEYSFYIPNAFTPDDDGKNDIFLGKGMGIVDYNLSIFDRWGNFIFSSDELDKGWNGKVNNGSETSQQDVYVWKVSITDVFTKKHNYTGTVTIVKGR
jgi:gliding motility-associated-like protein